MASARTERRAAERAEPRLVEGRTCWRRVHASRLAFLVDAQAYFSAFKSAVARARRSVLVLSWDFDSRIRLAPDAPTDGPWPDELGAFLNAVASQPGGPEVYVLNWDFAMIYAFERELFPVYRLDWRTHPRLHFRLDDRHPPGGSHHQKVVVVDDRVAFAGGLDLAAVRWDTPEHRPDDPRRTRPNGSRYGPFHDVQVIVEGEAAAALGELARERWRRATGTALEPPVVESDPWPPGLAHDLADVVVGIARTDPEWEGRPAVLEVEALHLEAIRAARRWIYIENQYLSSGRVAAALAERLEEREGPEVVVVVPQRCAGWLEEATMGVARARVLERLRQADRHGRLRVYYPAVDGLAEGACLNVHSKVLVADDEIARVGSANASNRSMRLDTECDVALEARGDPRVAAAIASLRDRLLAEHLGVSREEVAEAIASKGSLVLAVESLRGGPRTLEPVPIEHDVLTDQIAPDSELLDLERPVGTDLVTERLVGTGGSRPWSRWPSLLAGAAVVGVLLVLAARTLPGGERIDLSGWIEAARGLAGTPLALLAVIGVFVAASAVLVPVLVLIPATGLVFGPVNGFVYALVAAVTSASVFYGTGRVVGEAPLRRFAGRWVTMASRKLAKHGVTAVAAVRLLPVAPSPIVDLLAGALRVRFRDFFFGTLIGMAPGTFVLTILGDRLGAAFREPGTASFVSFGVVLLVVAAGLLWRRLRSRRAERARTASAARG
ncbi:MAG TPA: VTT domain-containing protein [Thermodesulfobacteriota bacterium]